MAGTIPQILRQFKADVGRALSADLIGKICHYLGHGWRRWLLDPVSTVHVFLLQILHGSIALSRLAGAGGVLRERGEVDAGQGCLGLGGAGCRQRRREKSQTGRGAILSRSERATCAALRTTWARVGIGISYPAAGGKDRNEASRLDGLNLIPEMRKMQ